MAKGYLFDLDGVITRTADFHYQAWNEILNEALRFHSTPDVEQPPFSMDEYRRLINGRLRFEATEEFFRHRKLSHCIPAGTPTDNPGLNTLWAIAHKKNETFMKLVANASEVDLSYHSTVELLLHGVRNGIRVGVVSSSANCCKFLDLLHLRDVVHTIVDGTCAVRHHLKGKPEPDTYVLAARNLDLVPEDCVVFEDAASGVQAGRSGGFGLVVGLARNEGDDVQLSDAGADVVLKDLEGVSIDSINRWLSEAQRKS